jgi:20S proteasome subunit alpha 4
LEKNWSVGLSEAEAVRLTVRALLEVVDSGSKNMDLAVARAGAPVRMVSPEELQAVIADIEREQEEAKKSSAEGAAIAE